MTNNGKKKEPIVFLRDFNLPLPDRTELSIPLWAWNEGENWLLAGDNESGKAALADFIASHGAGRNFTGDFSVRDSPEAIRSVSFADAAKLIEYERKNDDSDFVEGGVSPGRTAIEFIGSTTGLTPARIAKHPVVQSLGVNRILERGIKFLSTGECRRLLLCEALVTSTKLLVLNEPFDGVDEEGRAIIMNVLTLYITNGGQVLLVMDRQGPIPKGITHALELHCGSIRFSGEIGSYRGIVADETDDARRCEQAERPATFAALGQAFAASIAHTPRDRQTEAFELVKMENVTVEWSGRKVLDSLSWTLNEGEHWLIRGPNGSGKTTLLELITGDNPQVFRNEVSIFGKPRGSGETIWEIKEKMGIVSYKMHVEYRMVGDLDVESVILSGLHDTIGLYRQKESGERARAGQWLALAGLSERADTRFSDLSFGEQRAVLIVRAMVKCPPLLILDEPCHGLDTQHRIRILDVLEAIGNSGLTTILHVTHDPEEILPCERHILELRPDETPMYRVRDRGPIEKAF